jgi:cytochrome d ubiquinol oxidase subunit II
METTWFMIVALMLATYAALDGFDFGVGIVHRLVGRTDDERRCILATIGPIWDGNEVWLLASGGVLFAAFPRVYATAFSGFYMALMIVLWLLILRGIAIEFRVHQDHPLANQFWDTIFSAASLALALAFGATLGNLLRGVPVRADGLRGMPLFTNFLAGREPGIFDWYTVLVGLFAVVTLAGHGALFLVWRTEGLVRERSLALAETAWKAVLGLWLAVTAATIWVNPGTISSLPARPWTVVFVAIWIAGYCGVSTFPRRGRELAAFVSSTAFVFGMVATAFASNFPFWLRSTIDPADSLSAYNTATALHGMRVALSWWVVGIVLAAVYFTFMFRSIRGKVRLGAPTHDY